MVRTVPTGRDSEIVEIPPARCPNGHALAGNCLVGYGASPAGRPARCWTCRTCHAITWDED